MDPLDVDSRLSEVLFVLKLSGDLDLDTQSRFESTLFGLLDRGSVVVDLTRLDFMAISSLRSLVLGHRYAASRKRAVVFAGAPRQARRLLSVSRLDGVLDVRPSVEAAWDGLPNPAGGVRVTFWLGREALTESALDESAPPAHVDLRRAELSS